MVLASTLLRSGASPLARRHDATLRVSFWRMARRFPVALRARAMPGRMALALLAAPLFPQDGVATDPSCERYAVHDLTLGMSHDMIRVRMADDGVRALIRTEDGNESSGVDYHGPSFDVYVQYDRRIDRRPTARAVLIRAAMPLSPEEIQSVIDRFGPPTAGAAELQRGLVDGSAIWLDEACGIVVSVYRDSGSWWTTNGGTILQVETLDRNRRGEFPAKVRLDELLAPKPDETITPPPSLQLVLVATPSDDASAAPPVPQASPPEQAMPPVSQSPPPKQTMPPVPQTAPPKQTPPPAIPKASPRSDGPAERITFVPPVYPPTAKWLGVKGHVTLAIVVRADGTVGARPRVISARPPGRGFEEAAIEAVRAWRYKPATRGGRPIASNLNVDLEFE